MDWILSLAVVLSFLVSLVGTTLWIRKCRSSGLLWEDMNKFGKPKNVAASGGIGVILGFLVGILFYIAFRTFLLHATDSVTVPLFALMTVILILALVGLTDDFLGWHHGGLSARVRVLLAIFASIPLVVINAGDSTISLPFFGTVDLGWMYSLILIPVGIAATTTVYNFLAGVDGLESGLGILIIGFLSYVAYVTGSAWLAIVGLCMVASLFAFWLFNKAPARVFPGDVLTYCIGAMIGSMAILGNFERIAFIVFIPFIVEMILKVRGYFAFNNGKFPQSFGIPQKDGSLKMPYKKVYGLTHFAMWTLSKIKAKVYKNDIVYFIYVIQIIFILLAFLML